MFKFSIRKIIPLPFIFKRIDNGKLWGVGEGILTKLQIIKQNVELLNSTASEQDKIINFMIEYTNIFIEAQLALNKICETIVL